NEEILEFLREERAAGREIHLATASNLRLAQKVAGYLGLFKEVFASDDQTNLKGKVKGERLRQYFGSRGFDYVGDSKSDLAVWRHAAGAITVGLSSASLLRVKQMVGVQGVFPPLKRERWRDVLKALRVHQWSKNLLIFLPVFAAHKVFVPAVVARSILAFCAF